MLNIYSRVIQYLSPSLWIAHMFSNFLKFTNSSLSLWLPISKVRHELVIPAPDLLYINILQSCQWKHIVIVVREFTENGLLLWLNRHYTLLNLREYCDQLCFPTEFCFMLPLVFVCTQFTFLFAHCVYLSHFITKLYVCVFISV